MKRIKNQVKVCILCFAITRGLCEILFEVKTKLHCKSMCRGAWKFTPYTEAVGVCTPKS